MTKAKEFRLHPLFWLFPIVVVLDYLLHLLLPDAQISSDTGTYSNLLILAFAVYTILTVLAWFFKKIRIGFNPNIPLYIALFIFFGLWDLFTLKLDLLALPYFPGPEKVLGVFPSEAAYLAESTFHSLRLLFTGYFIGGILGLITGVAIGWSRRAHYWVNPIFKFIGPIPATAWVPIAMNVFPSSFAAGVYLIALSVWFSVTFMTSSGIAGVKNSYLEVAKTLGANRWFLIFKVAIPAAFPLIFIGLFMGLGMSFATIIVAEMLGVKAGLGFFITWAQGWGELSKVYAALILIAILFSSLIAILFKIKDHLLIWQKGLIKW